MPDLSPPAAAHPAAPVLPHASFDFADARRKMVDGQLTPARVRDKRIVDAMRALPRERFVFPDQQAIAYMDRDVPLGGGRVLMEPRILGRLVQITEPRAGERALVVGAGTGYGAALLAALGLSVTALEEEKRLLDLARVATVDAGYRIAFQHGRLADGLPGAEPFDLVLIEGAVEFIPDAIAANVAPAGRLATVLVQGGDPGRGVLAEHSGARLRPWPHFDAATAVLPGFTHPPAFRF